MVNLLIQKLHYYNLNLFYYFPIDSSNKMCCIKASFRKWCLSCCNLPRCASFLLCIFAIEYSGKIHIIVQILKNVIIKLLWCLHMHMWEFRSERKNFAGFALHLKLFSYGKSNIAKTDLQLFDTFLILVSEYFWTMQSVKLYLTFFIANIDYLFNRHMKRCHNCTSGF